MKTIKLLTTLVAVCALAIGCTKEYAQKLDEIQLSQTMVALSAQEYDVCEVMVTAKGDWKIETELPSWLSVTPTSGAAGTTKVVFENPEGTKYPIVTCNSVTLKISCNGKTQYLMVQQGISAPLNDEDTAFTADEVIEKYDKGELSKGMEFYVKGVVKSAAIDTGYGNAEFYLVVNDHPGKDFELFRCNDLGGEKFTDANKVKAGDSVVAYGSLTEYNGLLELAKGCKLIKIIKSEIELKNESELTVGKDGGEITAKLVVNGGDFRFGKASDFLTVKEIVNIPEEKNEKGKVISPAMTGVVIKVAANIGAPREGTIDFMSGNSKITAKISQAGEKMQIKNIAVNSPAYVGGVVTAINNRGFVLTDETGSVLYYVASGFDQTKYAIGDKVDITCSKVTTFGGAFQLESTNVTEITEPVHDSYTYPEAEVLDQEKVNTFVAASTNALAKYVKFTAKANISEDKKYYNFFFEDGQTNGLSLYQGTDAQKALFENGKTYDVTGYLVSRSSSKYANIVVVSVEEAGALWPASLEGTTWRYDVPDDADNGFMLITFIDETNCYLIQGDKEGIWWEDLEDQMGTYTFDSEKKEGVAFDAYTFKLLPDGTLDVADGTYIMHKVDYIPVPQN